MSSALPVETDGRAGLIAELDRIGALLSGGAAAPARDAGELDRMARALGLSGFERDVLLLTAAAELDGSVAQAIADRQDGEAAPTFALALAVLPGPHWDAITAARPLRHRGLVRLGAGGTLATRPLRIDEDVLHRIAGAPGGGLDRLVELDPPVAEPTASQDALAAELATAVRAIEGRVLVALDGADPDTRATVASRLAALLGGGVLAVRDGLVDERGLAEAAAAVDRECLLDGRLVRTDHEPLLRLLETEVAVTEAAASVPGRVTVSRTVELPTVAERMELWRSGAPEAASPKELAYAFRLPARAIAAVCAEWSATPGVDQTELRRLARDRARVGFGRLAQRVDVRATWDDLVLPDAQVALLRDIERQVHHRSQVYDDWGFAASTSRGLGVSALFAGESGTGKTMAAEVIAGSLELDLQRIDLAAIASKYIGETEKNLGTVFDAGEASGAVLLFDEADALFSKRSDVKDSHDRYANLEVAYLLQRMEEYRGLAILTTNLRSNLDRAFLRRIRFVVQFPFPDAAARAEIWRRTLPAAAPQDGIDPVALAAMQLSGGAIRSVALSAAFAAADAGSAITPAHLLRAARLEAAKAERPLPDAETAPLRQAVAP